MALTVYCCCCCCCCCPQGQCDYFGSKTVLPQAVGWIITVAFGAGEICSLLQPPDRCVVLCHAVLCCKVYPVHFNCSVAWLRFTACQESLNHCAACCGVLMYRAVSCCAVLCCAAVFTLFTSVALWLDSRFSACCIHSDICTVLTCVLCHAVLCHAVLQCSPCSPPSLCGWTPALPPMLAALRRSALLGVQ